MWVLLFALVAQVGQVGPSAQDAVAIQAAKSAIVRSIDASLPSTTFEVWLRGVVGDSAAMTWSVNDCGEQTGDPVQDKGRDFPICAEVEVALSGQRTLSVSLVVGRFKAGVSGRLAFWSTYLKSADGSIEWIKSLGAIPGAINRKHVWLQRLRG